jgi:putative NAD(P)H nitroreductase
MSSKDSDIYSSNHSTLKECVENRSAVRRFSNRPISDEILHEICALANRAPSGFNIQPWYFVIVQDEVRKRRLSYVAMGQKQIIEASATIVFVSDPYAWKTSFRKVAKQSVHQGIWSEEREKTLSKQIKLFFLIGPLGIFGFLKKLALPFVRMRFPMARVMTSTDDLENYAMRQTMLASMTLLLSAKHFGVDSSPIEGFDEDRTKRLLKIPRSMRVPMIVALGYGIEGFEELKSYRLPVDEKIHFEEWGK